MLEARRIKSNTEKASIQIQKEIDYAAEHGRGETIVHTGDFYLASNERQAISKCLEAYGYKHRWRDCNNETERLHVWWEDTYD
jgi:hypothetical protein